MRRKASFGAAIVVLMFAISSAVAVQPMNAPAPIKNYESATAIHQEVDFQASPKLIYETLLDSKQFAAFSGFPAEIDRQPGGAFKCFGGIITGRNIELVPNKRIVQAWRSSWPEGIYSIVKFELKEQGTGTRLILDHSGFPDGTMEHLEEGWKSHYWEPLRKYLSK